MQDELDKAISTMTSGPTKRMLARNLPTENKVNFSLYTRHALMTVDGYAEFDGEHLWVRNKTGASGVMLDADADVDAWELYYTLEGERKVKLMVSHVAREKFLDV